MDALAAQVNALVEFPIDFEGQKKVDRIVFFAIYAAIPISVLAGAVTQNIVNLLVAFAACVIVTLVVVLPAWPQYKKNPVEWLQVKYNF